MHDSGRVTTHYFRCVQGINRSLHANYARQHLCLTHTVVSFVSPTISAIVVNQCLWSKLTLKQNIVRSRLSKQQVQYEWTPH